MSSPLHAIDEDRPDRPPERKKPPPRPSQPTFACSAKSDYEPYLSVRSPLRLPGGYSFEAELDGQRVVATVPAGGVEEGETFDVPLPVESTDADGRPVLRSWGEWRDGLCDCCDVGPVHPALWYSICCRLGETGRVLLDPCFCTGITYISSDITASRISSHASQYFWGRSRAV